MRHGLKASVSLIAVFALGATLTTASRADEGMWTFDNIPANAMREEYGFAPDQAWLDRVRAASVRLESGCSGAILSAQGLVQTNSHCVSECVSNLATAEENLLETGFRAERRNDERRCEGMAVQVVTEIRDVTDEIDAATAGAGAQSFASARDAAIARIESECRAGVADRRCQVITLYQGGRYALHTYQRYDDVRLVFAPEDAAAFFGGDPDNFNFPRYCFDVAYLRLYQDGRPAATPNFLRWRSTPLAEGEMTFVSGNPGGTSRQLTLSEMAFQRDSFLPWRLAYLAELRGRLISFGERGDNERRISTDLLLNVENGYKALNGERNSLVEPGGWRTVERREADLRQRISRNRAVQRDVGNAWDEVSAAMEAYRGFYLAHQFAEVRAGAGSELIGYARDIVRGAADRELPDGERMPAYTSARLGSIEAELFAATPIEQEIEEILISFWLSKMREALTADDPFVRRVLGRESPEGLAHRLVTQTRLADPAERRRLWEGGQAAVAASDDPLIVFVRAWDADARALRARYRTEVEGPVARAHERLARARFQTFGSSVYPDATFTLRLSYGRVAGWTEPGGRVIAPFTRFSGLFERATGAPPYALAPSWSAAQGRLDPNTIFNFSTTHDIVGGNSGSPVIDREGRVVGAAFDGNIHSLGGEYFYDGRLNRAIAVASTGIEEALLDVYGMDDLVRELRGQ
ncbi:MAG: S46 family peptidase [Hyphomonadaceae bacterium]